MPFETVVPAPAVDWWGELYYPMLPVGTPIPVAGSSNYYWLSPNLMTGLISGTLATGGSGGGGVTDQLQTRQGRLCRAIGSTGVAVATGFAFPWWTFDGNGGASENSGYGEWQGARSAWFRFGLNISAVDATWGSGSGIYFLPYNGTGFDATYLPGGALFNGGVGIAGDGAGGLKYYSWGAGLANLLESVAVPAAATQTITKWSIVDFFFRAATPTAAGYLTVRVNGTDVVLQRSYGSGLLSAPSDVSANNWTYQLGFGIRDPGTGTLMRTWMHARFGRFTMDGTELQQ